MATPSKRMNVSLLKQVPMGSHHSDLSTDLVPMDAIHEESSDYLEDNLIMGDVSVHFFCKYRLSFPIINRI